MQRELSFEAMTQKCAFEISTRFGYVSMRRDIRRGGEKVVDVLTIHFRPKFEGRLYGNIEVGLVPGIIRVHDAEGAPENKPQFADHTKNEVTMLKLLEERKAEYDSALSTYSFPQAYQRDYPPVDARAYLAREPWPFPQLLSEDYLDLIRPNKHGQGTRVFHLQGIDGKRFDDFAQELEELPMNLKEKSLLMFMVFKRIYRIAKILSLEGVSPRDFSQRNLLITPSAEVYSIDRGEDYISYPYAAYEENFKQFLDYIDIFLQENPELGILKKIHSYFKSIFLESHRVLEIRYIKQFADYDMYLDSTLFSSNKLYQRLEEGDLAHDEYLYRLLQGDFLLQAEQRLGLKYANASFRHALGKVYSRVDALSDTKIAEIRNDISRVIQEKVLNADTNDRV